MTVSLPAASWREQRELPLRFPHEEDEEARKLPAFKIRVATNNRAAPRTCEFNGTKTTQTAATNAREQKVLISFVVEPSFPLSRFTVTSFIM